MTVTDVIADRDALTLTLTADYASATPEQVWDLWADPRKLERWWGPPTYPATFVDHDFTAGGRATYYMTGPEGDKHYGYWEISAVQPPSELRFTDGFADAEGKPDTTLPGTTTVVTVAASGGGARMVIRTSFADVEAMNTLIEMGMEEGFKLALGQTDAILAEAA